MADNHNLTVTPTELKFALQTNKTLQKILVLQNVTSEKVAFKVKTTAPKRYCVRPNAQVLEPGKSQEVQVLLQPLKELPDNLVCKDKFLVQSLTLKSDDPPVDDLKIFWDKIGESDRKIAIVDQKLKCSFTVAEDANNATSPAYSDSAAPTSAKFTGPASPSVDRASSAEKDRKHAQEIEARDLKIKNLQDERNKLITSLEDVKKKLTELQSRSANTISGQSPTPPDTLVAQKGGGTNLMLVAVVGLICALLGHFIPDLLL
jgi:D-Tyr-tRNAtyr deacylase